MYVVRSTYIYTGTRMSAVLISAAFKTGRKQTRTQLKFELFSSVWRVGGFRPKDSSAFIGCVSVFWFETTEWIIGIELIPTTYTGGLFSTIYINKQMKQPAVLLAWQRYCTPVVWQAINKKPSRMSWVQYAFFAGARWSISRSIPNGGWTYITG